MTEYSTPSFGSLIRKVLKDHQMNFSEFATLLGYKSKTSIIRIANDETSYSVRSQFAKLLFQKSLLDEEEKAALQKALEVSRYPKHFLRSSMAFRSLLGIDRNEASPSLAIQDAAGMVSTTEELGALLRVVAASSATMECTLFGMPFHAVFQDLIPLLSELHPRFAFSHYLASEEAAQPQTIARIAPVLFKPWYRLYQIPEHLSLPQNHLFIHFERSDGNTHDMLLIQYGKDRFLTDSHAEVGSFCDFYRRLFYTVPCSMLNTRIEPVYAPDSLVPTIRYFKTQLDLINGRELYIIGHTFPFGFLKPNLFRSAVDTEYLISRYARNLKTLVDTHQELYDNLHKKRTPTYLILPQEDIRFFAEKGRFRNQPEIFRTFSFHERFSILRALHKEIIDNPLIFFRFSNPELELPGSFTDLICANSGNKTDESTLYLLQNSLPSSYSIAPCHSSKLCADYAQYYRESLFADYTLSRKETLSALEILLQYLQDKSGKNR